MSKYIPSTSKWVRDQVELYETSGGTKGTTMNWLPVIIVTNIGWKTKAIRKTPLMKVTHGKQYILVASNGGSENHPFWYKNIKLEPKIKIQELLLVLFGLVRKISSLFSDFETIWNKHIVQY